MLDPFKPLKGFKPQIKMLNNIKRTFFSSKACGKNKQYAIITPLK